MSTITPTPPVAAYGGWPLLLLLIALVVLALAACRAAALADDEIRRFRLDVDPVPPDYLEGEVLELGSWTFFDWQVDAPDLA